MKHFVIGPKGGVLSFVHQETGEAWELPLPQGVYPLSRFAPLCGPGEIICAPGPRLDGQNFVRSLGNTVSIKPVGQFESAANPSFRVSPAAKQLKEITRMMRRTEALEKRARKQLTAARRAAAAVPQIEAPKPEDVGTVPTT